MFPHFIVTFQVENVSDQFERVLVVVEIGIESCQIKAVRKVVFIDLAKVFVASRRDELLTHTSANVLPQMGFDEGFWQKTLFQTLEWKQGDASLGYKTSQTQ